MPSDNHTDNFLRSQALAYHSQSPRGKLSVTPTKRLAGPSDLALAYSPGVAFPCLEIARDPLLAEQYTSRSNLVGVVTNGTAVLGLGDIGALASKPVMEGKACLFKAFAGIDVFDVEVAEKDPERFVDVVAALEPTFGGINLEDIKAPECFYIEKRLSERMRIPVFHDDQHGTAVIATAAILNALHIAQKQPSDVRVVISGAGAAAIACAEFLLRMGIRQANMLMVDSAGVIYDGRPDLPAAKARFAVATHRRSLADAMQGADVFLGCSTAGVLQPSMVQAMASDPIILALANPEPEIRPELAMVARPDCIVATGRSDYPNQVNNVLCFPYIFRGSLDCGATRITAEMKDACVAELAAIAREPAPQEVMDAAGRLLAFGRDYLIPTPFDKRLLTRIAPAVARAAAASGVASRPIEDFDAYRRVLASAA